MQGNIKTLKDSATSQSVFPITISEAVYVDKNTSLKAKLDDWKSKMGEGFGCYVLELKRWGVKNNATDFTNKTDAANNSIGINMALQWAFTQGYTEVIMPLGTYLVDEDNFIVPQSFMTLNLGGSTLRVRDNGLQGYSIVKFGNNQIFSRITNGKIQGDRLTHDYTSGGTHEGGIGVTIFGGARFTSVDNLEIFDCTGDALGAGGADGQTSQSIASSALWEQGAVNLTNGTLTTSTTKIRLIGTYVLSAAPLIVSNGFFGIYGDGYGGLGTDVIARYFDVVFYASDNSFLSSINSADFYEEIDIPVGAKYAKLVLDQPSVPTNITMTVRSVEHPRNTYIEKCNMHHCRRQGMSLAGKWIYVRDNEVHHIGGTTQLDGTAPMGGMDIEDGYAGNQWIFIDSNYFHGNQNYSIVMKASRNVRITNNKIRGKYGASSNSYNTNFSFSVGSQQMFVSQNTFLHTNITFYGEAIVSNNYFEGCTINLATEDATRDKDVLINNCYFYNSSITLTRTSKYKIRISDCSFISDTNKSFLGILQTITFGNSPQTFSNCIFKGDDVNFLFANQSNNLGGWIFNGVVFQDVTKGVALPAGSYSDCIFDNCGLVGTSNGGSSLTNLTWVFRGCRFDLITDCLQITSGLYVNISECIITSQGNGYGIQLDGNNVECRMVNCSIRFPNGTNTTEFIQVKPTYTGTKVLFDNNEFSCPSAFKKRIINVIGSGYVDAGLTLKNNTLINANLSYIYPGKVTLFNNMIDGVMDSINFISSIANNTYLKLYQKLYNNSFTTSSPEGWVCTQEGYANNTSWAASTSYSAWTKINSSGHVYIAMNAGKSTATTPTFPTASGSTVSDSVGTTTWTTTPTAYSVGNLVLPPSSNGYYYECTTAGTSSATPPTWATTSGNTVTDGTVVWTARQIITWKEIGLLAVVKQFGTIT